MDKPQSLIEELMRTRSLPILRRDRDAAAASVPARLNTEKLVLQTADALDAYARIFVEEMNKANRLRKHKVIEVRHFMACCIAVGRLEYELAGHNPKFPHWKWTDAEWDHFHQERFEAFQKQPSSEPSRPSRSSRLTTRS